MIMLDYDLIFWALFLRLWGTSQFIYEEGYAVNIFMSS